MDYKIATLAGDGIGPEIVDQAIKAMKAVGEKFGHTFDFQFAPTGATAIEEVGEPYPESTHEVCMNADAVLFGAIGDPKYDNDPTAKVRPEQGLLLMRKKLGLYANIRPVATFPSLIDKSPLKNDRVEGADFVVVRELTGGIYFGEKGRSEDLKKAFDTSTYTVEEIERILKLAYGYAAKRNKRVTVVDKANVLCTSRLWREVAQRLEKEYADIETDYMFVDNAAMQLVQWPKKFDVLVTENMFGDILSDEASVITGSLGIVAFCFCRCAYFCIRANPWIIPASGWKEHCKPCSYHPFSSHVVGIFRSVGRSQSCKRCCQRFFGCELRNGGHLKRSFQVYFGSR